MTGAGPDATRASATHHPALDGLRGVAILAVVLLHFTAYGGMSGDGAVDATVRSLAMGGWMGVDLFFVLSGYLITGILIDTRGTEGYYQTFYMRRTLRIFPLYFVFLATMFFLLKPPLSDTVLFADLDGQGWYWTYLTNWWISFDGWPDNPALGHLWSLAVEEQFYLVWPFVVAALPGRRLIGASAALVVAGPFVRAGFGAAGLAEAADVNLLSRMDSLAIGGLIAAIARSPSGLAPLRSWIRLMGVAAAALMAVIWAMRGEFDGGDPIVYTGGFSLVAAVSSSLIVEAVEPDGHQGLRRTLTWRWLTSLGTYSYGIYVLHGPISTWLPYLFSVDDLPTIAGSQLPAQIIYWAVGLGSSWAVALVSWRLIEQPFLALKRRFAYSVDAARAIAPPATS